MPDKSAIGNPQSEIPAEWPAVTCLCPTYGRFELLRLALACFLAQDYPGEKTLLVWNDAEIEIGDAGRFDEVICINTLGFPTLGHKRQALLDAATTPLVAHWDDDDLYLPWHLKRSVGAILARQAGCVKSRGAWYVTGRPPNLSVRGVHHNVFEGSMVFRREEALELGGYPPRHSGQARALMEAFKKAGRLYAIKDSELGGPSCVYRWGQGCGHISTFKNRPDSLEAFQARNCDFGDLQPLTPGDLSPYWAALQSHPSYRSYTSHSVPQEAP